MREVTLNCVYKANDSSNEMMFEVIIYDPYNIKSIEMWYLDLKAMQDLYNKSPDVDWYFDDNKIHYRCNEYRVDIDLINQMLGTKSSYYVKNYILSKFQEWVLGDLYYISPNYKTAKNPDRYIHKMAACKVSGSTLKVYISFVGDEGWRSEVLYCMPKYGQQPVLGDFQIGSFKELKAPELTLTGTTKFGDKEMFLYKVVLSNIHLSPISSPSSMPLPSSLINTLACEVDFTHYTASMLGSFKNLIGEAIGIEKDSFSSGPRGPKKDEDVLKITTGAMTPDRDMKNNLLKRALVIAKGVCDDNPDLTGEELILSYRDKEQFVTNQLAVENYTIYEMYAIDAMTECLLLQKGEKDLRTYMCAEEKLASLKCHELLCALYLLRYRISALEGTMHKGIGNAMYYKGGKYPYDSIVLMD